VQNMKNNSLEPGSANPRSLPDKVRISRGAHTVGTSPAWRTATQASIIAAFVFIVVSRGVVNRIGVSFGLREGSSAIALSFWPFLAATVILAPFAFSPGRPRAAAWRLLALKGAVSVGLCQILFVLSQQWGSATFASIASALVPVVAALMAARTEPISRRVALGGALALGGAVTFALVRSGASGGERPLAAVVAASAALLTAAWFYLHNRSRPGAAAPSLHDALSRVWPQFLSSTVVLGVCALFAGGSQTSLSLWWLIVLIGVVGYAAPLVVSVWMLPRAGVALATSTNYAIIPLTALASMVLLGARFTAAGWASLGVVLIGLWVSLSGRGKTTTSTRPVSARDAVTPMRHEPRAAST
jgi:drug/metabolite transporter (DMT)-like permease